MTGPNEADLRPLRAQQQNVLERIAASHDVAYTRLEAATRSLRFMESLLDLDVYAVKFVERELAEVLHRLDGVRFAVERMHAKVAAS